MGCYVAPLFAAIAHYFYRKKTPKLGKEHKWLNLLFAGGAIFGVIDHLWYGQLFVFNRMDMLLGLLITLITVGVWGIIVWKDKLSEKSPSSSQI